MSVAEYTYVHAPTGTEVFVRRQGDLIIDVYTDRDAWFLRHQGRKSVLVTTKEATEIESRHYSNAPRRHGRAAHFLKWRSEKNPLFVHANHVGAAYRFIRYLGFTSHGDDPKEPS